jgi:hypothetical protein
MFKHIQKEVLDVLICLLDYGLNGGLHAAVSMDIENAMQN